MQAATKAILLMRTVTETDGDKDMNQHQHDATEQVVKDIVETARERDGLRARVRQLEEEARNRSFVIDQLQSELAAVKDQRDFYSRHSIAAATRLNDIMIAQETVQKLVGTLLDAAANFAEHAPSQNIEEPPHAPQRPAAADAYGLRNHAPANDAAGTHRPDVSAYTDRFHPSEITYIDRADDRGDGR